MKEAGEKGIQMIWLHLCKILEGELESIVTEKLEIGWGQGWMEGWMIKRHKETSGSSRCVSCCLGCGVHTCQNG